MAIQSVAVIGGTGEAGFGLALRWALSGIEVIIGSRDKGRAEAAAQRLKEQAGDVPVKGYENSAAAGATDVVVVAVPFAGQATIYKSIAPSIRDGAVVIDCTVPLAAAVGAKVSHLLGVWQGSAAQQGASFLEKGKGTVCAAFHTLSASALEDIDQSLDGDVLVCGSRKEAKARVRELVEAIPGLRYIDAGPLENARILEPLTALLIGINRRYKTDRAGVKITGLPI
jgi:8-hydroxy-5-deazaflavin:NADPH oxidoreductase